MSAKDDSSKHAEAKTEENDEETVTLPGNSKESYAGICYRKNEDGSFAMSASDTGAVKRANDRMVAINDK